MGDWSMSTLFVNNLNTASGSTITIPTGKTLVGTDTASIKAPGNVIQVVTKTFGDQTTVTSYGTTYTDVTNGTIAITPKFNNSQILIIPNLSILIQDSGTTYAYFGVRCLRGSSTVLSPGLNLDSNGSYDYGIGIGPASGVMSSLQFDTRVTAHHIDTPATTSATTYKFQVINYSDGRTTTVNYTGGSTILAMEIAQ